MENPPFEDVFPIENGDFPASYVCLPEGNMVSPENDTQKGIPNLELPSLVASKPLNLDIPSHSHIASGQCRSPNKKIQQEIHFVAAIRYPFQKNK